jgi:serralysin
MDGTWIFDLRDFVGPPLKAGLHELVATSSPPDDTGSMGETSSPVLVNVGSGEANLLYPQVPAGTDRKPSYVFGGPGDDVIAAYGRPPGGARPSLIADAVVLDGGRELTSDGVIRGGHDIVVLLIPLGELEAHQRQGSPGGAPSFVLQTGHTAVTLFQMERIAFTDLTLTVQADPHVDFLFYAMTYRDIALADLDARAHYDAYGWQEGRDPNALFSTRGYLAEYGDVRAAGFNPLDHYHVSGWREGRDPSAGFDTAFYLRTNPDVAAANTDPLYHFLLHGEAEGRHISPVIGSTTVRDGFDDHYYSLSYPDVTEAGMDGRIHFEIFGSDEGRNPSAFFDTNFYRAHSPDVAVTGADPLAHYNVFGWREGRDPSSHFNTRAYLDAYVDVAAAGINPLQHFLQFGSAEGRLTFGEPF